MRKDIILFFSIPVVSIEVDGVSVYGIVQNIFKVLRMSASGDRDYFIKGNNSIIPRVYGHMNTSLSPRLGAFFDYIKKVKVIKGKMKMRDFLVLFLRKAHNTEHPSRGCPHLVLISQLSRLKQCG